MAIVRSEYFSQARHGFMSFTAVLPVDPPPSRDAAPAYAKGPWKTIYLLHGYSGSRNDWLRNSEIEQFAGTQGFAVVMPDGGNSFYLDSAETGESWGAMVGEELVNVTRAMFSLSPKREDTVIAGLSMGGFGAIRNGLRYADTFGTIFGFSSALIEEDVASMTPEKGGHNDIPYGYYRHTFGEPNKLLGTDKDPAWLASERLREGNAPRLFLSCGSEDFLYENNKAYHQYLDSIGYPHEWWVRGGVHDFTFWNQALPAALEWWREAR